MKLADLIEAYDKRDYGGSKAGGFGFASFTAPTAHMKDKKRKVNKNKKLRKTRRK